MKMSPSSAKQGYKFPFFHSTWIYGVPMFVQHGARYLKYKAEFYTISELKHSHISTHSYSNSYQWETKIKNF